VDGNDPIAMYGVAKDAVNRARAGQGPALIEARTFRFYGHNYGDSGEYIPKSQYENALSKDPFPLLREMIKREGIATEKQLLAIELDNNEQIEEAIRFAENSPCPDPAEVMDDVYA
jgi:pyruvate dehydrogenase E1 component alpha subunit